MRKLTAIAVAVVTGGLALPVSAASPDDVVAAERAFAADAQARGFVAAFKTYAADDAIGFQPDVVNIQQSLAAQSDAPPDRALKWWPIWAGIAASGDLGFTTGPFTYADKRFGHYFTVWAKQPDGAWRWIYDGGPRNDAPSPFGPDTAPVYLGVATGKSHSDKTAWDEVSAAEAQLAKAAASDVKRAYGAYLAADARIMGSTAQPAVDATSRAAELERRPASIAFNPLGGRASKAGDFVYTYGDAKWSAPANAAQRGHYVRIWQKRAEGWRLVFDEILAVPAS